jgi:hypothetical protein
MAIERTVIENLHTILGVPVEEKKPGSRFIGEGLAQRVNDPICGRMGRNVKVQDTPATVTDEEEANRAHRT